MAIIMERAERFLAARSFQLALISSILILICTMPASGVGITSCLYGALFGFDCPGCGLTRALIATSHGDINLALQLHLAGPFIFGYLVLIFVDRLMIVTTKRPLFSALHALSAGTVIVTTTIVGWGIRHLG